MPLPLSHVVQTGAIGQEYGEYGIISYRPPQPSYASAPLTCGADGRHWAGVRQVRHHPGDGHVFQAPRVPAVGHRGAALLPKIVSFALYDSKPRSLQLWAVECCCFYLLGGCCCFYLLGGAVVRCAATQQAPPCSRGPSSWAHAQQRHTPPQPFLFTAISTIPPASWHLFVLQVKNVDIEAMPRSEEKEMFKDFMEEYNTATLPHKWVLDQ